MPVVSNKYRTDGIGTQYQTIILCIVYANYNNLPFKYTPLVSVDHNYQNDDKFIDRMENLMNIKNNFPEIDKDDKIMNDYNVILNFIDHNIDELYNKGYFNPIKHFFLV